MPILKDNVLISLAEFIITCIGLGFACFARVHLGKNWSSIPEVKKEHTLIKSGPYQIVRHPIYTGFLVGIIGSALMIGSFLFFYILVVVLIVFIIKIRIEEKLMLTRFPDEYTQYKKDVKALIPYIY
ncbi:methyltransferase family protein [Methanospirillum lacunae]|uniref:methyltransferase family protein n=1 Tax=Methanospirillum lacunae TaxID=668570 RepID=UPI0015E83D4B|nr:isoprenylcysteine carboxylmethyltransferase family protein [Methanospirillum lacunae]